MCALQAPDRIRARRGPRRVGRDRGAENTTFEGTISDDAEDVSLEPHVAVCLPPVAIRP